MKSDVSVVSVTEGCAFIVDTDALTTLTTESNIRGFACHVGRQRNQLTLRVVSSEVFLLPVIQIPYCKIERGHRRIEDDARRRADPPRKIDSAVHIARQGSYRSGQAAPEPVIGCVDSRIIRAQWRHV